MEQIVNQQNVEHITKGHEYLKLASQNKSDNFIINYFCEQQNIIKKSYNLLRAGNEFIKGSNIELASMAYLSFMKEYRKTLDKSLIDYLLSFQALQQYINTCNKFNYIINQDEVNLFVEFIIENIIGERLAGLSSVQNTVNMIEELLNLVNNLKLPIGETIITFFEKEIKPETDEYLFFEKRYAKIYELIGLNYALSNKELAIVYYKIAIDNYKKSYSNMDLFRLLKIVSKIQIKNKYYSEASLAYFNCTILSKVFKTHKSYKYYVKYLICKMIDQNNFDCIKDELETYLKKYTTFINSKEYKILKDYIEKGEIHNLDAYEYII